MNASAEESRTATLLLKGLLFVLFAAVMFAGEHLALIEFQPERATQLALQQLSANDMSALRTFEAVKNMLMIATSLTVVFVCILVFQREIIWLLRWPLLGRRSGFDGHERQ
jgi:hypothetical protein